MSTERTLYATQSAITKEDEPTTNFSSGTREPLWARGDAYAHDMYVSFTPPEDMQYNNIDLMRAYVYIVPDGSAGLEISELDGGFDEDTITYQNAPYASSLTQFTEGVTSAQYVSCLVQDAASAILHGLQVSPRGFCSADTSRGSNKPYILVQFSDEKSTLSIKNASPSGGYTPKNKPVTFSWTVQKYGDCFGELQQSSAVLRYRENEGSPATEVQLSNKTSYTLSSGISTDAFQWQIEITNSAGGVTTSPWYTLSTVEELSTASVVSPKNVVVDATRPITFTWSHQIGTGTDQTKAELQYSTDNSGFETFALVEGNADTYTAPAGTLPGGTVYWRVRTYNTDGAAGEWSTSEGVIVVGAPTAPVVTCDNAPRLTVSWQAEGQQAFEVVVGLLKSGVRYGTGKRYTFDEYLPDGTYTAQVRVQNSYGLWSDWGQAETSVANVPGDNLQLEVVPGDGNLLLFGGAAYDSYRIYRDGVLVGMSKAQQFQDQFAAAGEHVYQVRGVYDASGNYGLSNSVEVSAGVSALMIFDLDTRVWLRIPMTLKDSGGIISVERAVTFTHYSGEDFPTAEIGEAVDRSYQIAPVFLYNVLSDAKRFEAMLGKLVFLKDEYGTGIFGIMSGYSMSVNAYMRSYTATIREVAVDEATVNG